jgi:hypothetical protein
MATDGTGKVVVIVFYEPQRIWFAPGEKRCIKMQLCGSRVGMSYPGWERHCTADLAKSPPILAFCVGNGPNGRFDSRRGEFYTRDTLYAKSVPDWWS